MSETIASLTAKFEAFKKAVRTDGKKLLGEFFKEELPECVRAVQWTQYTPHFNDGDPCTFSVNDPSFLLAEEPEEGQFYEETDDEDEEGNARKWLSPSYGARGKAAVACRAFAKAMSEVPDDFYQAAFDDGVRVTVTRTDSGGVEITVDEYDHD